MKVVHYYHTVNQHMGNGAEKLITLIGGLPREVKGAVYVYPKWPY